MRSDFVDMQFVVPTSVELMLTARCNLHCPFCYGPDPRSPKREELSPGDWNAVVNYLARRGVQEFVLAGGEPTVAASLERVVQAVADCNRVSLLQTNATNSEVVFRVLDRLSWLCLPVDGVTGFSQQVLRTSSVHSEVSLAMLREARARNPDMRIKVGTVVTTHNASELEDIERALLKAGPPTVWKLYDVRSRGAQADEARSMRVGAEDWSKVSAWAASSDRSFRVVASGRNESDRAYLIVNPDGRLLVPDGDWYLEFGQIVQDGRIDEVAFVSAVAAVRPDRVLANFVKSFPEPGRIAIGVRALPRLRGSDVDLDPSAELRGGRVWTDVFGKTG